jgi:NAD(P)-dependent dehydrogenase (short-subunit alcohol dehydrogenase family)
MSEPEFTPVPAPSPPQLVPPETFRGKVAVVTGGTDGLGRHLTRTLVSLGADVFFCGVNVKAGEDLVAEVGPQAHFVHVDLTDVQRTVAFINEAGGFRGHIDYLVNNAAIDPRCDFKDAKVEDFDLLVATNLRPYFVTSRAALPFLERGEGKAVVNMSTTNYMLGLPRFTLYAASKAGILGFTRSLARELGPLGIRVNSVAPGWIMTEKQLREHVTERDKRELMEDQALKFFLVEEHITPVTLFLLSPCAAAITGQNLIADAGKVMQ